MTVLAASFQLGRSKTFQNWYHFEVHLAVFRDATCAEPFPPLVWFLCTYCEHILNLIAWRYHFPLPVEVLPPPHNVIIAR